MVFQGRLVILAVMLAGCSTAQRGRDLSWLKDAAEASRLICSPRPGGPASVQGTLWMKAKSKEASGQFPASVQASPDKGLRIEVTQLMGARAALIEIRGQDFKIETPQQGAVSRKARSWGGIPLEWASALFMDRVPCPDPGLPGVTWSLGRLPTGEGELVGRVPSRSESWKFAISDRNGRLFVDSMRLERAGLQLIELKREDADPDDLWALKWEIKSPAGEVKVRWRERKVL